MKISTLAELQKVTFGENNEPLVLFQGVLIRKTVAEKLLSVQKKLKILVTEGYRSPAYQERYFLKRLLFEYDSGIPFDQLLEITHQCVALPSVAGHPTGGAVDVTLAGKDMGGEIADFSCLELLPTYSEKTTPEQRKNRLLLHDAMIAEGFAPFYGEWWHFSYGDLEWAAFYGETRSLYSPLHLI